MKKLCMGLIILLCLAAPAFAADPFAKVPAGHWAYDAVRQLASQGLISQNFNGKETVTRYEMANLIAKAVSKAEESHAKGNETELLKKLAAEFKAELEAIGKSTEKMERSIDKIERGIGSWNLAGTFIFDAVRSQNGGWTNKEVRNEWRKEQMYLYLTRRINENTTFYSEFRQGADGAGSEGSEAGMGDIAEHVLTHFYIDTELKDTSIRIGRFGVDFEEDYGLYDDNDGVFGHFRLDGFQLQRQFSKLRATAIVGKNRTTDDDIADNRDLDNFRTHSILDLQYQPNDKFFLGATGYWIIGNSAPAGFTEVNGNTALSTGANDWGIQVYSGYFNWNFAQGAKLKGIYYRQLLGKTVAGDFKDNPQSWKVILDLDQDLLKVGSLWLEYNAHDNNFWNTFPDRYSIAGSAHCSVGDNMPMNSEMSKFIFARFERAWNDKFETGIRYAYGDYGTEGFANPYELGVYLTWHLSPAMNMRLYYDHFDYGQNSSPAADFNGTDNVIMLRTTVEF